MAVKETAIQKAILQYLQIRQIFAWRQNNGAVYDPTRRAFRSGSSRKGVPDIIGILPGGRALLIEVKTPTGKASPEQAAFHDIARRLGALVIVARRVADVTAVLEAYIK